MASSFTWLDSSENDRRRAMEVIDVFRRQETRDELGLGTVRDALAELLSPGLSTIQTRAKYFLVVPWVYLTLERKKVSSADVIRRAREDELRVAAALARSDDRGGVIGIEAGRGLKRLPSAVYWGGLGTLGIRLFQGSQDHYHRSLDRFYAANARAESLREDDEGEVFRTANWHPHIPSAPKDLLTELSHALTREEALYLQDRFEARVPHSLVAFLARQEAGWEPTRFFWDEPLGSRYRQPLRTWVEHARCFSEVMHGAALLYNLLLSEAVPRDEWVAEYRQRIAEWIELVNERSAALASWDQHDFWKLVTEQDPRVPHPTRQFASRWIQLALRRDTAPDSAEKRTLVAEREAFLKRGRARLLHREYLEMWNGAAGAEPLNYRWATAQTIVGDILRGLGIHGAHARAA